METGGKDAIVRPWFWILWLLLGPVLGAIAVQWYIFVAVRLRFFASHCSHIYLITDGYDGPLPRHAYTAPL